MLHRPTISILLTLLLWSLTAAHYFVVEASMPIHHHGAAVGASYIRLHAIRGGSSTDPAAAGGGAGYHGAGAYHGAGTGAGVNQVQESQYPPPSSLDQESIQDRIDSWKTRQQEQYSATNMAADGTVPQSSLRDAEGRIKLITSVSKGSRSLIFFLLLWRDVHLYEVADSSLTGMVRLLVVTPLCLLFLANLAGVVASITSPSQSAKKRLKAILNLDKLVEALLICYNFVRLTVWPTKYIPREVYIANTLHSVFFLLQSQAFTRVTWDQISEQQSYTDRPTSYGGGGAPAGPSYHEAVSQHPTYGSSTTGGGGGYEQDIADGGGADDYQSGHQY